MIVIMLGLIVFVLYLIYARLSQETWTRQRTEITHLATQATMLKAVEQETSCGWGS